MDTAEHLRCSLHTYTNRTAPALGIDTYAEQVDEANHATIADVFSAGDNHDEP